MDKFLTKTTRKKDSEDNPKLPVNIASKFKQGSGSDLKTPEDIAVSMYPVQPKQISNGFPFTNGRRFNPEWYKKYTWLEYSTSRDAAFCHICRKFVDTKGSSQKGIIENKAFTTIGYRNWKSACEKGKGFEQHANSSTHISAQTDKEMQKKKLDTNASVSVQLTSDVYTRRRYYVKSIAQVVQFLAVNELPLRGSWEEGKERGMFTSLFEYTLTKDKQLADIAKSIPRNATYTSPEVQNDVIRIMAKMVSNGVAEDVKSSDANVFALFADGTRDKSNVENVAVGVRYVKGGKAYENILTIQRTDQLDAKSIACLLLDELKKFGLDTSRMISQCYDGCRTMSGEHGGVQRLIQNELGREIPYVHCHNHRLHLVVVKMVESIPDISTYFDELETVYKFFRKLDVVNLYEGTNLKRVLDTRWSGHFDATVTILKNYSEVIHALNAVVISKKISTEEKAIATGLRQIVKSDSFLICALIMKKILGILKPADSFLQSKENDVNSAIILIEGADSLLSCARINEEFEKIWEEAEACRLSVSAGEKNEMMPPKRSRVAPKMMDDFIVEARMTATTSSKNSDDENVDKCEKKRLYFEVIDVVRNEMARRFSDNKILYESISALSRDSDKFLNLESLEPLSRLSLIEIPSEAELQVSKTFLSSFQNTNQPHEDAAFVLAKLYSMRSAFPKVYKMFAAVASIGTSTAICESSFSALSRIDDPSRRSMLQSRKGDLTLMAYEKSRVQAIDLDDFLLAFAADHCRLPLC